MSYEDSSSKRRNLSPLIPFLMLSASVVTFLVWQIVDINTQASIMNETKTQLTEESKKREAAVQQSAQIQKNFQTLLEDVLKMADTNENAKAIIKKYNIQTANPPAPVPAASPP